VTEQFKVEPTYLHGYGGQLKRNAGFVGKMHEHMSSEGSKTDKMDGLLSPIVDGYKKVFDWQLKILDTMRQKLEDTSTALETTAKDYDHADKDAAAKLDQAYQGASPPPTGTGGRRPI
jgi:Excreted virulence factor EspC, type VII ESX diderm